MKDSVFKTFILLAVINIAIYIFVMYYDYTHETSYADYTVWLNLLLPIYPPLQFYLDKKKEEKNKK